MTLRIVALFGHLVGMVALFVALVIEWLSSEYESSSTVLLSASLPRTLRKVTGVAAALIVTSGIYLALQVGVLGSGWVRVSFGAMVLMAALGAAAPRSLRTRAAVALAIVYVMIAKPELLGSLAVIGLSLLIGVAATLPRWRGRSTGFERQTAPYGTR